MIMKLIDLKKKKKTKAEIKKENTIGYPDEDLYPWGLRLSFEKEVVDKLGGLKGLEVGDEVDLKGVAKVVEVRSNETRKGADRRVELQVVKIGLAARDDVEEAFDEVIDE